MEPAFEEKKESTFLRKLHLFNIFNNCPWKHLVLQFFFFLFQCERSSCHSVTFIIKDSFVDL